MGLQVNRQRYQSILNGLDTAPLFAPPVSESTLPYLSATLLAIAFASAFYSTTLHKSSLTEMGYAVFASLSAGFGIVLLFASVGINGPVHMWILLQMYRASVVVSTNKSNLKMTIHALANFPKDLDLSRSLLHSPSPLLDDETFGIAGVTWPASACLIEYIVNDSQWEFDPPSKFLFSKPSLDQSDDRLKYGRDRFILDLGSGTGHLPKSLAEKIQMKNVELLATDLEEVIPLLQKNLAGTKVQVAKLEWGSEEDVNQLIRSYGYPNLILASDTVYFTFLHPKLVRTLLALTENNDTKVLIGALERSWTRESSFWSALGCYFELTPILSRSSQGTEGMWQRHRRDIYLNLFIAERRKESQNRCLAQTLTDEQLMNGLGGDQEGTGRVEELRLMEMEWE